MTTDDSPAPASLREVRRRHLLTLRQLAEQSGIYYSTIARIEQGKQVVSLRTIKKIAEALGVPPESVEEFRRGMGLPPFTPSTTPATPPTPARRAARPRAKR